MKLKNLLNARKIIIQYKDEKLSPTLAYKFVKFMKASDSEEAFYNDKLKQLIEEYALKDENGQIATQDGNIRLIPAKIQDFNNAANELQETEVEAPNVQFKISELEQIKLSVTDLYALDDFVEE